MNPAVIDFINTNRDRYLEELKQYLAIPSVSALPDHAADVRRCADWTADHMRQIGLQNVRVIDTPGHPVVYGDWLHAPGAPTVLFYGHYDVQPVDPLDLWTTPPFEATVRDDELYARGATDDKGQLFVHLKAIEAHLTQGGSLPVNARVILEGEEEIGSPNLNQFILEHKDDLACDVVVISDSPMFDKGVPSICYGLRGLSYFQIDLRGTSSDLHSGSFGGAVANPAFVLAQVLSQMKDRGGHVKIPGFYDDVRALTDREREEFKRLPFNEKQYQKQLAAPRLHGETGLLDARARLGAPDLRGERPAGRFHGRGRQDGHSRHGDGEDLHAPGAEPGPGQDLPPSSRTYVKKVTPKSVELKVTRMHGGKPWMTELDNRFVQAAARAIEMGFNRTPVYTREGGSIPVVATFQSELNAPTVLFGLGLPDENAHAPNEKLDLGNFYGGILASAYLYEEIAKQGSGVGA